MYDYTSNNWSHWNSNEKLKEKSGSYTRQTFDRFTTKDSYTWNITRNGESTAVWNLKPERWGSPLFQEKYQEEKACDKRRRRWRWWWSLSGGNHRWFKRSTRKKRLVTRDDDDDDEAWAVGITAGSREVPGRKGLWQETMMMMMMMMMTKPERWGSPLVQEKYQEEKACNKRRRRRRRRWWW